MADTLLVNGTFSLELSAKGAASDVRSWERNKVGTNGARLFINNHAQPGDVDTIINRNRGRVGIGTSSPTAKLSVVSGSERVGLQVNNTSDAVRGRSESGHGVSGVSNSHTGTEGGSNSGIGVHGLSGSGTGVLGESNTGPGVVAQTVQALHILEARSQPNNRLVFAVRRDGAVEAQGPYIGPADFAELLPAAGSHVDYELGDVLVIGKDGHLTLAEHPQSTTVAGVYSANPGFVGDKRIATDEVAGFHAGHSDGWLPVALVGVVPVKASAENGPIEPGDLLVTSVTPGHAMLALPARIQGIDVYPTGAILGKALEPLDEGLGLISVLLTPR